LYTNELEMSGDSLHQHTTLGRIERLARRITRSLVVGGANGMVMPRRPV
jgi:hypothetical protein